MQRPVPIIRHGVQAALGRAVLILLVVILFWQGKQCEDDNLAGWPFLLLDLLRTGLQSISDSVEGCADHYLCLMEHNPSYRVGIGTTHTTACLQHP